MHPAPPLSQAMAALLSHGSVVVFAVDRQGSVTISEGAGLLPLGLRPGEALGRKVSDLYGHVPAILADIGKALDGEPQLTTVLVGDRWFLTQYVPVGDDAGAIGGVAGIALDVTEHQLPLHLIDNLGIVTWVADPGTLRIRVVTGRPAALMGLDSDAWLAPDFWRARIPAQNLESFEALLRAVASDGEERHLVHRMRNGTGRERWFRTAVSCGRDESDGIVALVGVMFEVSSRKEAQAFLTAQESRLRLLLEQLPALVWTVDRDLRFTTGVGGAMADLGVRGETALTGVSLFDYFHTDDPEFPPIAAHRRAIEGHRVSYEQTWAGRTFECHVEPFRGADGHVIGAVGVALDITERTRAEAARDRLLVAEGEARAAAEEALRVREDFLSIASHELATPLTSLQLAIQGASQAVDAGEAVPQPLLRAAERQCHRLGRLVEELLSVSRMEAGHLVPDPQPTDLVALTHAVIERFSPDAARARCPVRVHAPSTLVAPVDRSQLELVVGNLLANALKYGAGKPVDIHLEQRSAVVRLAVVDHGIGIAPEELPRIFGRFERAVSRQSYGGLGLGLYITRHIVASHGGSIRAESAPGAGATFSIELPRTSSPQDRRAAP